MCGALILLMTMGLPSPPSLSLCYRLNFTKVKKNRPEKSCKALGGNNRHNSPQLKMKSYDFKLVFYTLKNIF